MAYLGAIGHLVDGALVNPFVKDNACSVDRDTNPVRGVLFSDSEYTASFQSQFVVFAGTVKSTEHEPVNRIVRIVNRATGHIVGATRSSAVNGQFTVKAPSGMVVDLHIMSQGDGCDIYYPSMSS